MRRLATCALACVLAAGAARGAQVTGFVDVSYSWNLNNPLAGP